jgi:hypothetical protein
MTLAKSEGMDSQHATPPDDGGHMGAHTQEEQTLLGVGRDHDTQSSENLGKTEHQPRHPNSGLVWFWAAIAAFCIGLMILARAYL